MVAFGHLDIADSIAMSFGITGVCADLAVFTFLSFSIAPLVLRCDTGLLAGRLIWELSLLGEGASVVVPVALVSCAIFSLECLWAGELHWGSIFVTTAFEFGLSRFMIVECSSLAPSAFEVGFFSVDT